MLTVRQTTLYSTLYMILNIAVTQRYQGRLSRHSLLHLKNSFLKGAGKQDEVRSLMQNPQTVKLSASSSKFFIYYTKEKTGLFRKVQGKRLWEGR